MLQFDAAADLASMNAFDVKRDILPIVKTILLPFKRKFGEETEVVILAEVVSYVKQQLKVMH